MHNLEDIKRNIDLLALVEIDTQLKRVASTAGSEYAGRCPFCGGEDRFRAQPFHKNGPRWYCRGCGENRWHSGIDYLMRRDGKSFKDALNELDPSHRIKGKDMKKPDIKEQFNRDQWCETAFEFSGDSIDHLWQPEGKGALDYLHGRGLSDETLSRWRVGFNPVEGYGDPNEWGFPDGERVFLPRGIVILCQDSVDLHYLKIRRGSGKPKYMMIKGSHQWLFGAMTFLDRSVAFLFEGEFDVMLATETTFHGVGYGSLPAAQKLKREYDPFFASLEYLLLAQDFDEPGEKAAKDMLKLSPLFVRVDTLPTGKDLTECYQALGIQACLDWLFNQIGRIKP